MRLRKRRSARPSIARLLGNVVAIALLVSGSGCMTTSRNGLSEFTSQSANESRREDSQLAAFEGMERRRPFVHRSLEHHESSTSAGLGTRLIPSMTHGRELESQTNSQPRTGPWHGMNALREGDRALAGTSNRPTTAVGPFNRVTQRARHVSFDQPALAQGESSRRAESNTNGSQDSPLFRPQDPIDGSDDQHPNELSPLPLQGMSNADDVDVEVNDNRISLRVREAPLDTVLAVLAQEVGLDLIASSGVDDTITITLSDVPLGTALDAILSMANCSWVEQNGIIKVWKISEGEMTDPNSHGRLLRVYSLNFASAADVQLAVDGLLSPIGHSSILSTDPLNERKTIEQIIVEDIPRNIQRIDQLIDQLDQPPRQVMIQAYILQVTLGDETQHGININDLPGIGDFGVSTAGFANPLAVPTGFVTINGASMNALVQLIKRTTDAKTLASPKVMVINGQKSRVQIGERLGFQVTTTTETSTLQDVQFLEVGVVLDVTPQITDDGRVLLRVKPKVSGGQIQDGLPQEETTEVETAVLLEDGRGVVIGGLIQEVNDDNQSKLPWLGDLWSIGRLFQRRDRNRERNEIIVALVPYLVPSGMYFDEHAMDEWNRATTPLLHGPLDPLDRPWEYQLPDAEHDPRRMRWDRLRDIPPNLNDSHPLPREHFLPRASRNDRYFPNQGMSPYENAQPHSSFSPPSSNHELHFQEIPR